MNRTPSLANPPVPTMPPGTRSTAPLHGILPVACIRYVYDYVYGYVYGLLHLHLRCDCYDHTSVLQVHPLPHLIYLHEPCHWHQQFRWSPFSTRFNSRFSIWLDSIGFFPGSIRLTTNTFIFNPNHIIRIPSQSGFREYHIGQGVFEIPQHWNCGIFHNYDNWNYVWREHSNKTKKSEKRRGKINKQNISTPQLI